MSYLRQAGCSCTPAPSPTRRRAINWEAVQETIMLHEANREDHTDHLLTLMNLEIWCRIYLDGESPADLAAQIKAGALQ
jgi:asparagine synthase (glutamine-hydrolysing)